MFPSIFTDELAMDFAEALPIIKSWGLDYVDLRGRIFGRGCEYLTDEQLAQVKDLLDQYDMKVGCFQSSLCKVHWPDAEGRKEEEKKLEGLIRAADALDCRLVRSFFYWQPEKKESGALAVRPDVLQKTLNMFMPIAERAKEAGLVLAFENCGVTPDEIFTMLDALNEPTFGMAWDGNSHWDSEQRIADETEWIVKMARAAKCVHVKAHGMVESVSEYMVPWDRVLAACAAAGVPGPVSAETHNPDRTVSNVDMSRLVVEGMKRAWPSAAPGDIYEAAKPRRTVTRSYEDDPVRFVIVGLGMGHNRAREITQTPGAELVGVCDLREDRCKRTGEEFGVPWNTDLDYWLAKPEVEVIWDIVPTGAHAEIAVKALKAGKHVLSTKPMEATLAACDDMIRAADEAGKLLGVDFALRFTPATLEFKAALEQGFFGRLLSGQVSAKIKRTQEYYDENGGWRGTRRWDGGGVLSNQNVHALDELAFCFGIPKRVKAAIWTQAHDIEAEDLGMAFWEYENGLVINLYATTSYPQPTWYQRLEVHGTEGAMSMARGGPVEKPHTLWYTKDGAWTSLAPVQVTAPWLGPGDNFAAAVRTGEPLLCTGRDGRRSQSILDAMYRSAYGDGGWVEVDPEYKG